MITQADIDQFLSSIAIQLAWEGSTHARAAMRRTTRNTLANAMAPIAEPVVGQAVIHIPHYWARWVNFGRPASVAPAGKTLIWWDDPAEDPRRMAMGGASPQRLWQSRRLTKDEFYAALRERLLDPNSGIHITPYSRATTGERFFENDAGMSGFQAEANAFAGPQVQRFLTEGLQDLNFSMVGRWAI